MSTKHRRGRLSGPALLLFIPLAAACGGTSGSKATPLAPATTVVAPTTGSAATKPTAAELASLQADLNAAGSDLGGSGAAINGSDVSQAKTQEGSAP